MDKIPYMVMRILSLIMGMCFTYTQIAPSQ